LVQGDSVSDHARAICHRLALGIDIGQARQPSGSVAFEFVTVDAFAVRRRLAGAVEKGHLPVAPRGITLKGHVSGAGSVLGIKAADVDEMRPSRLAAGGTIVDHTPQNNAVSIPRRRF